jgi:tRNA G18 (ribose-2'-O)-methylase SpoU
MNQPATKETNKMTDKNKSGRDNHVSLLLHNIRSAHNVGSIFRTADAAGISKIFLTGYTPRPVDRFGRRVKEIAKTALGAESVVAWQHQDEPMEILRQARKAKVQIIGIEQARGSKNYRKVKVKKPALFVLGNELAGLSKRILNQCDVVAEIPMKGKKESLNVVVACGIALYQMLGL